MSLATDIARARMCASKPRQSVDRTEDMIGIKSPFTHVHLWWWRRTAPLMATFLHHAGPYTPAQQADHMRVYCDVVVPSFGPPTPQAAVNPLLTMDNSPVEPLWNFQNNGTVIRYSSEPLQPNDDSETPFRGDKVFAMLPQLQEVASGTETQWLEHVWAQWFLTDKEEVAKAKASLSPHRPRMPQIFLAFDMKGGQRLMKVYLFPVLKHPWISIPASAVSSCEQLTWDAIRNLKPGGERFGKAVEKPSRFLSSYKEPIPVEMIAFDCVDPARARVKVYARTKTDSKATLQDCCT